MLVQRARLEFRGTRIRSQWLSNLAITALKLPARYSEISEVLSQRRISVGSPHHATALKCRN